MRSNTRATYTDKLDIQAHFSATHLGTLHYETVYENELQVMTPGIPFLDHTGR